MTRKCKYSLQAIERNFFNRCKTNNDSKAIAHFWVYHNNLKTPYEIASACHAALRRHAPRAQAIGTLVNSYYFNLHLKNGEITRRDALLYFDWLLNRSPWAEVFITKNSKFAIQYGVLCRTDVPGNMLLSACTAIRYVIENPRPAIVALFNRFVSNGNDENTSFLLAHKVYYRMKGKTLTSHHDSVADTTDTLSFIEGKVKHKSPIYCDKPEHITVYGGKRTVHGMFGIEREESCISCVKYKTKIEKVKTFYGTEDRLVPDVTEDELFETYLSVIYKEIKEVNG